MQRRFVSILVAVIMLFLLAVPAFAFDLPYSTVVDGNTRIGTFFVQGAKSKDVFKVWREWQKSDRNVLCLAPDNSYYFFIVPDGATLTLENSTAITVLATWSKSVSALTFKRNNEGYEFVRESVFAVHTPMEIKGIVTGTYFAGDNLSLPALSYNYIANYEGTLEIVDDIDDSEDEEKGFWGKIWDWLVNFFKKLGELFISLFVPEEGYFTNWYNSLKTALDNKIGGLTRLYDAIKAVFIGFESSTAVTDTLMITLPDNYLYRGYKGTSANILTTALPYLKYIKPWLNGIMVIITAIVCYKRVVVIFEQ